jgi:hypothetical protein
VITAAALTGAPGKALTGTIGFADSTSSSMAVTISGLPAGMSLVLSGQTVTVRWSSPVAGNYVLLVSARDGNGQTATINVPVTITGSKL